MTLIEKSPPVLNPMAEWPWKTEGATVNENSDRDEPGQATVSCEMPRYKCHKEVWALKIKDVILQPAGGHLIIPADAGYAAFHVSDEYRAKHKPEVGGYYVVYADGYKSYSPAKAFEEGYSLAEMNALELGAAARAAGPAGSYEK